MDSPLLQSLFDDEERRPLTISELNEQVKADLERRFSSVWIEGEIIDFYDASSGHWYFTLHDSESQLKAACYKGANWRIRFKPFDGLQVRVRGKLTVYEPRGEYQILVESLEPVGEGALKIAFEQIKAKLEKDKLFDDEFKRPLPKFPRKVGVVTSPNGAAFHDILNVLSRRTKSVDIVLIPARVQGETAPKEVREGVLLANEFNKTASSGTKIEVLIVGRGGGSAEDLSAFNEEMLARAIFASEIPVISAVGHEIDFSIADLVADLRAPTPSAAAEIVAEREDDLERRIKQSVQTLTQLIEFRFFKARSELRELTLSSVFVEFPQKVKDWSYEIEDFERRMRDVLVESKAAKKKHYEEIARRLSPLRLASNLGNRKARLAKFDQRVRAIMDRLLAAKEEQMKVRMASLNALSPLAVLDRGFSLTQLENGEILRDASATKIDDAVKIKLAKGTIGARITKTE